jgi:type I restriction enzyme S subunit
MIRPRPATAVEAEEQPFDVPTTWQWARLSDVGYELGQKAPDHRFTYIDVGSIDSDKGVISDRVEVLEPNEAPSRARKVVSRGTLLYSTVRPYLLNIAIVDRDFDHEPIASTAFAILHPFTGISNRFLFYWLRSAPFIAYVQDAMKGMAYPAINDETFYSGVVPVPPGPEQKRIVTKVDKLMALCDRLEAQQQERDARHVELARAALARFADAPTPGNLNLLFHPSYTIASADLRKTILTLAVKGKLVPQDPNDEPAGTSFPRLASGAVRSDDDAFPAHWLRVPLGCTGEWRGGGTPSKSHMDFWQGDIPWVSPKDMKTLRISDAQDHISEAAVEASSVRMIPAGSLLMVVRGMILARAFPVALTTREVTINQDMKALLPFESETNQFLLVALRAYEPEVLRAVERSTHGTCKLPTEFLEGFLIGIPPLAEQRQIVATVDQLTALVDLLEKQLTASHTTAATLMEAVVAELAVEA